MPYDAGVVDGTPTRKRVSLSYIDINGQIRTDSYDVDLDSTNAEIAAFAAEMGALSNASLYDVQVVDHYATGTPSKGNAVVGADDSVKDNAVMLMKTVSNQAFDIFVPAPDESTLLQSGTVNPNPVGFETLLDTIAPIRAGYSVVSYRYSERSKKNKAIKA